MTSGRRRSKECGHCGALDSEDNRLSRCLGCYEALYCSEACQKSAWKKHRRRCRRASKQEDTLLLDDDQNTNFDVMLDYASRFLPNIKHVDIVINNDDYEADDTKGVVLTADTLQSFLELHKGKLESVFWRMEDREITNSGEKTKEGQVWTSLCGLKVLRMKLPVFSKSRDLCALLRQQETSIRSLALVDMALGHDMNVDPWCRQDCKLLSSAISRCTNLVRLDLGYNYLRDENLEAILPCLPDLRILLLSGGFEGKAFLTDRSCKLIARECSDLQELDLSFHRKISVPGGVKRILKGCQQLRRLQASIRLQSNDIKSLICLAPNLLVLHTEFRFDETLFLDAVRETGGRLVLDYFDNENPTYGAENVYSIEGLSTEIQQTYKLSQDVCAEVFDDSVDSEVINEWERPLAEFGFD